MEIKEQFLRWIDSKGVFKGLPYESYIKRFVELLEFDPFIFNDDYSNILEVIYKIDNKKKELNNNELYNEFNRKCGNGVPKAIFGSRNYFSFLKELHFNYTINAVKDELVADKSTNGLLVFTTKRDKNWIFIKDAHDLIGNLKCHYELRLELDANKYSVEVHFEGDNTSYNRFLPFLNTFLTLNKDESQNNTGLWKRKRDDKYCIRSGSEYLIGTPNLAQILKDNLVYLENNLGDRLRQIIDPNFQPNHSVASVVIPNKTETKQMNHPLNQILFGPPGTGKTYNTINRAISIINPQFNLNQERDAVKAEYDRLVKEGQIVFCTFHQNMSYEDFIEGIKPITQDGKVVYEVQDGIFKQLCITANTPHQGYFNISYEKLQKKLSEVDRLSLRTPTGKQFEISLNSNGNLTLHTGSEKKQQGTLTKQNIQRQINGEDMFVGWDGYFKGVITMLETEFGYVNKNLKVGSKPNFVLIIDEINRGNVSSIFGELITLIEDDKRIDADEELRVVLPYSKELFGVPSNVHIIGTMNTADRSVEALDTALRRRFTFTEMPPKSELISRSIQLRDSNEQTYEVNLEKMLDTINSRIERLIDKDHKIGHSYFINVQSEDDLKEAFRNKVIPLLEEYFFGDFGKIGLVLGDSFVEKVNGGFEFAAFSGYDSNVAQDLKERCVYAIKDSSLWNFRSIYTPNKAQ